MFPFPKAEEVTKGRKGNQNKTDAPAGRNTRAEHGCCSSGQVFLSGALTARNELHGKQYSVLASAGILLIGPVVVDRGCPLPSPIPGERIKKAHTKPFHSLSPVPNGLRIPVH